MVDIREEAQPDGDTAGPSSAGGGGDASSGGGGRSEPGSQRQSFSFIVSSFAHYTAASSNIT